MDGAISPADGWRAGCSLLPAPRLFGGRHAHQQPLFGKNKINRK